MTMANLAERVAALEAEVANLKAKVEGQSSRESWWNKNSQEARAEEW